MGCNGPKLFRRLPLVQLLQHQDLFRFGVKNDRWIVGNRHRQPTWKLSEKVIAAKHRADRYMRLKRTIA